MNSGFIGDGGRIRQIVTNILGNAVKFTLQGHIVISVTGTRSGDTTNLEIQVTDTGISIPAEQLETIFNEFEQVDGAANRQFEGTGLGLAISNRLVRLMGGSISVRSDVGKGSIFTILLPLEQSDEIKLEQPISTVDLRGKKVLIVDDIQLNRTIISERLRTWGILHKTVSSGQHALEVLNSAEKSHIQFDTIVLDYNMPGMNGRELALKIRKLKSYKKTPLILLSSVDVERKETSKQAVHFEACLLKPVRAAALQAALAQALSPVKAPLPTHKNAVPDTKNTVLETNALDGLSVLVAEDNRTNQLVLRTMLKIFKINITMCENGLTALETYKTQRPDMVLMDMSMPVMDGLEATLGIRNYEKQAGLLPCPIIALTANAMTGDRDRCIEVGMNDYLSKPVAKVQLIATMTKWAENLRAQQSSGTGLLDQTSFKRKSQKYGSRASYNTELLEPVHGLLCAK